jgi:hypothetical protein
MTNTITTEGLEQQDAPAGEHHRRAEAVAWLHARLDWEDRMRELNDGASRVGNLERPVSSLASPTVSTTR